MRGGNSFLVLVFQYNVCNPQTIVSLHFSAIKKAFSRFLSLCSILQHSFFDSWVNFTWSPPFSFGSLWFYVDMNCTFIRLFVSNTFLPLSFLFSLMKIILCLRQFILWMLCNECIVFPFSSQQKIRLKRLYLIVLLFPLLSLTYFLVVSGCLWLRERERESVWFPHMYVASLFKYLTDNFLVFCCVLRLHSDPVFYV